MYRIQYQKYQCRDGITHRRSHSRATGAVFGYPPVIEQHVGNYSGNHRFHRHPGLSFTSDVHIQHFVDDHQQYARHEYFQHFGAFCKSRAIHQANHKIGQAIKSYCDHENENERKTQQAAYFERKFSWIFCTSTSRENDGTQNSRYLPQHLHQHCAFGIDPQLIGIGPFFQQHHIYFVVETGDQCSAGIDHS